MLDVFNLLVVGLEKLWWVKSNSCWYLPRIGMRLKHLHCSTGPPFFASCIFRATTGAQGGRGCHSWVYVWRWEVLTTVHTTRDSPTSVHSAQCTESDHTAHCTLHTAQRTVHRGTPPPLFREDNVTLARGGSLVLKEGLSSLSKTPSPDQEMSNNYSW